MRAKGSWYRAPTCTFPSLWIARRLAGLGKAALGTPLRVMVGEDHAG